jgi:PEGA domain
MRRMYGWLLAAACAAGLTGCVERRFVVTTDPPGAMVLVNNRPLGSAPADGRFDYYGTYEFTLIADGYETLTVREPIRAPWYEYFPLDFASENLWPFHIEDVRRFHYPMRPLCQPNTKELLDQAERLRQRGSTLQGEAQQQP